MYMIVDEMHAEYPGLTKDIYWDTNCFEITLPYTGATIEDLLKEDTEDEMMSTKNIL